MIRNAFLLGLLSSVVACSAGEARELQHRTAPLYQGPTDKFFARGAHIPVCWATPGWAAEKARVEAAIAGAWLTQANLDVVFEPTCPTQPDARRVRMAIGVHTDNSSMGGNGTAYASGPDALTGPEDLAIRFWFKPDGTTARGRIDYLAVHEFGHVLGFSHEQDQDAPGAIACRKGMCEAEKTRQENAGNTFDMPSCMADADNNEGGSPLGAFDPDSIMNYCAPRVGTHGRLSDGDGVAVRRVYGKRPLALDEDEAAAAVAHLETPYGGSEVAVVRAPEGSVTYLERDAPGQFWYLKEDLGGQVLGTPAVATLGAEVYVFARGTDDAVWYKHRAADRSDGGWVSLGGAISARPAVIASPGGRLDLFVRGLDGAAYHKAFYGGDWVPTGQNWEPLGGYVLGAMSAVAVGTNQVQVFAVGADRSLVRKASDDWGRFEGRPWENLGGWVEGTPAVVSPAPSQVAVVVKGADRALYYKRFNGVSWLPSPADYEPLGRTIVGSPTLSTTGSGRIDLFAQDDVGQLIHTWAETRDLHVFPSRGPGFSGTWDELGGLLYGSPAAYAHGNEHDAVTRRSGNAAWSRSWSRDTWTPWLDMRGSVGW
jgi:hypothetical protein